MAIGKTNLENLEVVITANAEQFKKEIKEVKGEVQSLGGKVQSSTTQTNASMVKMGAVAGAVGAIVIKGLEVIGRALKEVTINSTKMAMEAIESETRVSIVFGEATQEIRNWSNELQRAIGLNAYELRKDAATLYAIVEGLGVGGENAMTLSKGFTQLSRDMSSFYDQPVEETFAKLRSGITGETEPLRKLGIIITQTTVKDAAYRYGIAKVGEQLSEQQKVLGRYMVVLEQTGFAQGDLARTLQSPANQLRLLKERLKQVSIELGSIFIPILTEVLKYVLAFVAILGEAIRAIMNFFGIMGIQVVKNGGKLNDSLDTTEESALGAAGGVKKLKKELMGLAEFDEMTVLKAPEDTGSGGAGAGGGLGKMSDFKLPEMDMGLDWLKKQTDEYKEKVLSLMEAIKGISAVLPLLVLGFSAIGAPVAAVIAGFTLLYAVSKDLRDGVTVLGNVIWDVLVAAFGVVKEYAIILWNILQPFVNFIGTILGGVLKGLASALSPLVGLFELLAYGIKWFGELIQPIIDILGEELKILANAFSVVYETVGLLIGFTGELVVSLGAGVSATRDSERANKDLERATDDLTKAKEDLNILNGSVADSELAVMDATDRVTEATKNLITAEEKYGVGSEQYKRASLELESANGRLGSATQRLKSDQEKLTKAQEDVTKAETKQKEATEKSQEALDNMNSQNAVSVADRVKEAFGSLGDKLGDVWGGFADTVTSSLRKVRNTINTFIGGVNSIKFPSWLGGGTINIKPIPAFATGGVVESPTLAMIGEAGREAVMPLDRNTEWIEELAGKIGNGGGTMNLTVKIGDEKIYQNVVDFINDKSMRSGVNLLNI